MGEKEESGRNYRPWCKEEDEKLVEALCDMVNAGLYKGDNGFKSGYLTYLEDKLKVSLPNSGLLGKPHIESRIKTLKKDWQVVHDMLNGPNTSGFGYDYENNCVTAEKSVWDAYIKVHQKAAKWRNKSFPHYEDLSNIFAKDRAKGNLARDAFDMEEDANKDEVNEEGDYIDESTAHTTMPATTNASEEFSMPIPKKKRARSQDPLLEGITSAASLLSQEIEASSTKLSAAIESDMDIQKKTSMVIPELSKMVSLTTRDRYRAVKKITCVPENVLVFFSFKEEEREDWVKYLLEDDA